MPLKTDVERLIPMTPELVQMLLVVLCRATGGEANVSCRSDTNRTRGRTATRSRTWSPAKLGAGQEVLSLSYVRELLSHLVASVGLSDAGRPITVDAAQLGRIEQMMQNAEGRMTEAEEKPWLGEGFALEGSLLHLRVRRHKARRLQPNGPVLASSRPTDGTLSR